MQKQKSFFTIIIMISIIAIAAILGCIYVLNKNMKLSKRYDALQKEANKKDMLLGVQEGNVFNLQDDIAVLQDSLRLIRIGEINISDTLVD